LWNHF